MKQPKNETTNATENLKERLGVTSLRGHGQMIGSEFPMDEEGRTYHVNTKKGEVANRIIVVGDLTRAELYASTYLDKDCKIFSRISHRGFATFTGKYKGVPVSIIGTGMGISMIDFTIRECSAIIDGPIAMIRLGTCGAISNDVKLGDVVVHDSSILISRNPDAFRKGGEHLDPYFISKPAKADKTLKTLLEKEMRKLLGDENVHVGMNATGDSFYGSQGRVTKHFDDRNENLIDNVKKKYPELLTLEMETFHLFDMSESSFGKLKCASATLVLAQRKKGDFISNELKLKNEKLLGKAGLEALIAYELK